MVSFEGVAEGHIIRKKLLDCPIVGVKLYNNRAEIRRRWDKINLTLSPPLQYPQENMLQDNSQPSSPSQVVEDKKFLLIFEGMSKCTIQNSVRVSGTGEATILEVIYNDKETKEIEPDAKWITKKNELQEKLKDLRAKEAELNSIKTRLADKAQFLHSYANSIAESTGRAEQISLYEAQANIKSTDSTEKWRRKLEDLLKQDTLDKVSIFMKFYRQQLIKLFAKEEQVDQQMKELRSELDRLEETIRRVEVKSSKKFENKLETAVLVETQHSQTNVSLFITYLVSGAQWKPTYDFRINTTDKSFNLHYFANVLQNTNEDWENVDLSLSTSDPNLSAKPPQLKPINLSLAQRYYAPTPSSASIGGLLKREMNYKNDSLQMETFEDAEMEEEDEASMPPPPPAMPGANAPTAQRVQLETKQATANTGSTSSTFMIEKPYTIPSDGQKHKVPIAVLTMPCSFEYQCVPKLDTNAFVQIKATNNSPFLILEGDAQIFFDDSFTCVAKMKAVSPGEEFVQFVGTDKSIKIEYKPPKKFRESKGFIKSNNKTTVTREATIKNTKAYPITMTMKDQFPRSIHESIVVKQIEPDFKGKQELLNVSSEVESIKLDDSNLIEWKLNIKPNSQIKVSLQYYVEWDGSKRITEDF